MWSRVLVRNRHVHARAIPKVLAFAWVRLVGSKRTEPPKRVLAFFARVPRVPRVPRVLKSEHSKKASTSAFRPVLGPDFQPRRVAVANVGGNGVVG